MQYSKAPFTVHLSPFTVHPSHNARQADFATGASLTLLSRVNLGEASVQTSATEVTDPSGATAGQCTTPGLRYFRYPLPLGSSTATHFFSIRVEKKR